MRTIILKFAGPLQSWGTDSHFETRHTDSHPSKSAVVGLIAAAMGYRRDDDEKIQKLNQFHFAVREDQTGRQLKDYHIAQKHKKNGDFERTYVTNRYYLEDAVFVAAVGGDDDEWIDKVEKALRNPWFQPFLGRRSAPVTMDYILETCDGDVISTLKNYPWQAADWYKKKHSSKIPLYADAELLIGNDMYFRQDQVVSFSVKSGRKFQNRPESVIYIEMNSTPGHDAFEAIGD